MNCIIPVHEARRNLGELLNESFYQGKPFILTRGRKPMAAIIGTNEFRQILKVLEKHDPGLADTLAISANPEIQALLEEGDKNIKRGNLLPFDKTLLDK